MRMEAGSFAMFGKPCSARAGSGWNFPSAPESAVKVLMESIAVTLPRDGVEVPVGS